MKCPEPSPSYWHDLIAPDNVATLIAALAATFLAALLATAQYRKQKEADRKDARAAGYAAAIQATEDYLEAPYLILRRTETPEAITALTSWISEVQSRMQYSKAWMQVHAPDDIRDLYDTLVGTVRSEAGPEMTTAWQTSPPDSGADLPIGTRLPRERSDAARAALVTEMRKDVGPEVG